MAHEFNPADIDNIEAAFYEFISSIEIDSKDEGVTKLVPFGAQVRFLDNVFDGLRKDIHWFVNLKARQLGVTTISLALDLFWISYFPGLQGALITDTDGNRVKLRLLLTRMIQSLPQKFKVPVFSNNKDGLVLGNGSSLDFLSAGVRKNGGLGRSRAYNFLHATECSSWGDKEGFESLQKSLSDKYPSRLYVFESTARGYNLFWDMWEDAKDDDLTKSAFFIGWWAKESYSFDTHSELFKRYGTQPPNKEEQNLIEKVEALYDHSITMNQLAWYRHEKDPSVDRPDYEQEGTDRDTIIDQEYPWHEEQAFLVTGVHFFNGPRINEVYKKSVTIPFLGYRYAVGENFLAMDIEPVNSRKASQLKVWEEPELGATYVVGADPAFGSSDEADRFVIQVCKCYGDGLDQVAEFVSPTIKAYQFAWIIAHLCGAYGNARLLLELNGPGEAVFTEFRNLRSQLQQGLIGADGDTKGVKNILDNVRTYMYSRYDSMVGGPTAWHWKTTTQSKVVVMNQLRDAFALDQIRIKSVDCLEEMRKVVQEGLSVKGEGSSKDDRVMALALAVRAWIDGERNTLMSNRITRESRQKASTGLDELDLQSEHMRGIIADYFARAEEQRKKAAGAAAQALRSRRYS